jgi:hypothetical protein
MSLFLRKACQDHLDGVDLQNYHIQVDDSTKCLQIVGECGDVLVSITGIRLSRMAPGDKEIALAIELFDDFLAKHAGTFKSFIEAKIRADKAAIPTRVPGLLNANVAKPNYQGYWALTFQLGANSDVTVSVRSDGKVSIPSYTVEVLSNPEQSLQCSFSVKEENAVRSWIVSCAEFNTATSDKETLLTMLSACEI